MSEQGRAPSTERCPSSSHEHDLQARCASQVSHSRQRKQLPKTDENKLAARTPKGIFADAAVPHEAVGLVQCSVDYELFWVRNDDEVETLVKPTEALLRVADELGTPFTIFVDLISVWRYAQLGRNDFVAAVNAQLLDAVQRGHDVQTHIHPHWLHATPDDARWRFDSKYFLLGNFGDEDEVHRLTRDLLVRAKEYLEGLLRPVAPAYRTVAYRAGGYGIQPGERAILRALVDAGYRIDSSIVPGMRMVTARNRIDFRSVPSQSNYYLAPDGGLERVAAAGILEVPILAGPVDVTAFLRRLMAYMRRWTSPSPQPLFGGGSSLEDETSTTATTGSFASSIRRKLGVVLGRRAVLNIPEDPEVLHNLTRRWLEAAGEQPRAASLLLHSKGLTGEMLDQLRDYVGRVRGEFGSRIAFTTFQDLVVPRRRGHGG
jgi:hypothetical protein